MTGHMRRRERRAREVYGRADVALVTPAQAAEHDRVAREHGGIPERVLMESAGRAAALVVARLWPHGRIGALAGSGNNGGDALVAARILRSWGRAVDVILAGSRPPDRALLHGHDVAQHTAEDAQRVVAGAAVIIDGILGTGLDGPARGFAASSIDAVNRSGCPVVALDLPSGLNGSTGVVDGPAVRADVTICFGWPKLGLLFHPARALCGRLLSVEIGFPPCADATARLITPEWAAARLPARRPDAHKGEAGRLLILAGREGMAGAAVLAALGARRAGAGLVRIASASANRVIAQTAVPEATWVDRSMLCASDLVGMHALVAGPGIGTDEESRAALDRALGLSGSMPVLLDADALNLFAGAPDELRRIARERPVIITPHAGELERLAGRPAADTRADPTTAARETADSFGCVVLLKGQPSIVAAPAAPLLVNTVGSSDTASAGMGDQLAGTIGALLAAGSPPMDAAAAGLFFSARAADIIALGRSAGPREVAEALHDAFARPGADRSSLDLPFVTFDQPARQ